MSAKQLSVFIENRQGRLDDVLSVLSKNGVNILSVSLADTTEYGILRLIVGEPEKGRDMLAKAGFSPVLTDVLIIKVEHKTGSLQKIMSVIASKNISIEYMYGLSVGGEQASIVLKTSQLSEAEKLLKENKIDFMTADDLKKLQ